MSTDDFSALNEELLTSVPEIAPDESGRLIGYCPEVEGEGSGQHYCWKLENPDPNARHDFWMMVSLVEAGPIGLYNEMIALDDGGYQHFAQYREFSRYMESKTIQIMKQSHGSFGVVSIAKLKAESYYRELKELFVGSRFRVGNYDANGDLVGSYTEVSEYDFPPFPQSFAGRMKKAKQSLPLETAIKLMEAEDYDEGRVIYFPTWEEDGLDDFIVEDGEELPQPKGGFRSIGAKTEQPRRAGLHIEFASHTGDPPHATSLFWYQPRHGPLRFLFGDYCSGVSHHSFSEHIFIKKKKSWFRTKTKITTIRKELIADAVLCGPIPS